jgi:hypothetical protein
MDDSPEISFEDRKRFLLYAWGIALVVHAVAILPQVELVLFLPALPEGIILLLFPFQACGNLSRHATTILTGFLLVGGWLLFLGPTIGALVTHKRTLYFGFYIFLCLMLILNAVGCHQQASGLNGLRGH